ncbi:hypothetical protein [Ornithinibacillus sp. FSL M8-0202]|uniref:hypothetical protein n=1 Tax=Ornithinibacillus sp. FSL M8-0202 TaxID=2921616 RepID=UPI0030CE2A96
MSNFRTLKLLDRFQFVFTKLDIDYPIMRKIVEIKLTMDSRRVPTLLNDMKKKEGNQFLKSLWIYALYGILLIPFLFIGNSYMLQSSIMLAIAMFILMTSMISDYSSVLLDVRDKVILNSKPINTRTINAAKLVHIAIYLAILTGAFIGIPAIVMLFVHGIWYFLIFILEIILLDLFIMALTALAYILILRFFDGEKLKDIINYVQIFLAVGIVIGYQVIIRVFDFMDMNVTYAFSWWHVLMPPLWFSAPFELLLNQNYTPEIILLSAMAILVPLLSIMLYYGLMPSFEKNLQKLMEESGKKKKQTWRLDRLFERLICFSKEERTFYRFASIMISRERDFKLKVYPSLGMALVFPFIFLYNNISLMDSVDWGNSKAYLTLYFANIIIGTVVYMLQFSSKYKGAWIFQTTPIHSESSVYSATLKAFLVKLYLPVFLILSVVYGWIFSIRIIPDILVILFTAILQVLLSYKLFNTGKFPFTRPFESAQQGGATAGIVIVLMLLVGVLALIHFLVSLITIGVYIYLALVAILTIVLWKMTFRKR